MTVENLMVPGVTPHEMYEDPDFDELVDRIVKARKNIVNRPTGQGCKGWHFCADHQITVPTLYDKVHERMNAE